MSGIFITLPLALVIAAVAVMAFIWAAKRDQFEDLDSPPRRMLLDDMPLPPSAGSADATTPTDEPRSTGASRGDSA